MYIKIRLVLAILLLATGVVAQDAYVTEKDINYYSDSLNSTDAYIASQCRLDLYYPKNKKDFATLIWFHGGGITGGSKELPKALMEKGYAVVGVGYRLSPKVKAPAYIKDAAVFNHIESYGGSRQLIFVSGHSAGGYLGMMITLDKTISPHLVSMQIVSPHLSLLADRQLLILL